MWINKYVSMVSCIAAVFLLTVPDNKIQAQQIIDLTLDRAVDISMENSYRVMHLRMSIERTRHYLKSRQAGLKSNAYMNLITPNINSTSDFKWNSTLERDELVRENTRRWQMELAVRQPVMLLGYPTNGYLSINNKIYQYLQRENGTEDVDYYNRYFVKFEQPLFTPNYLKNNLERAELDLEREELNFLSNIVEMIDEISGDYYELFELACEYEYYSQHEENLQRITDIVHEISARDTTRALEAMQVQVELANTRERLSEILIRMRIRTANMKQDLMLDPADSIHVSTDMKEIIPVHIDREQALAFGLELRPRLRTLAISRRRSELDLESTRAEDSFRMDIEMTYGLEKQDEDYENTWSEQDDSYSASVTAYIPIWDWGQRKERTLASEVTIRQTDLSIDDVRTGIITSITNAIDIVEVYQERALAMRENVTVARELTERGIEEYRQGRMSITDLIRIVTSNRDSAENYVEAYLGWRQSLLYLTVNTYYDYEKDMSLIDNILKRNLDGLSIVQTSATQNPN